MQGSLKRPAALFRNKSHDQHLRSSRHSYSPSRHLAQWRYWYARIPRWVRVLVIALVLTTAAAGFSRGVRDLHDQAVKRLPTDFSLLQVDRDPFWHPEQPIRRLDGVKIDDRYTFIKQLGAGKEGAAALYADSHRGDETVVIKSFIPEVARNPTPEGLENLFGSFTSHWPAEIEAGILLNNAHSGHNSVYLPVLDYFILQSAGHWTWNLVTPYVSQGNLLKLAATERAFNRSLDELDRLYRPILVELLHGLEPLHFAGLCHDDIKPDNIFIYAPDDWLLGDLGNVRHLEHSWHRARSWRRQNQWSECRYNDIRRAFKTYLWFLRSAVVDPEVFDRVFWEKETSWSRLHWDYEVSPAHLRTAIERAHFEPNQASPQSGLRVDAHEWPISASTLADATERELICTTIPRRLWETWWDWIPDI